MDCLELLLCVLARLILFTSGQAKQSLASCYYGALPKPIVSFLIESFLRKTEAGNGGNIESEGTLTKLCCDFSGRFTDLYLY